MTIDESMTAFLEDLADTRRSANTIRAYKNGLNYFRSLLQDEGLDPETEATRKITEQHVRDFLSGLDAEGRAKATMNLYLAAVRETDSDFHDRVCFPPLRGKTRPFRFKPWSRYEVLPGEKRVQDPLP